MLKPGSGVVVTGAARGIGRALASRLAAEGCRVVVADLDGVALAAAAEEIGAYPVAGDAASDGGVSRLVAQAREQLGRIDAWYGNAGIYRARGLAAAEEDWAVSYEVNVMAHVRAARLLIPAWLEQGGGRFVVTASAAGLLTNLTAPEYAVTKHGAVAFAEWLSATYRHRGIVVQAICPQGVKTAMLEQTGEAQAVVSHDAALEPDAVAAAAWEATQDNRFLVLPHPEVAGYYAARAADPDRWLAGMSRLQMRLEHSGQEAT